MCKKAGVPLPDFDGITGAVAQIGDCFHVYIASDMDNPVDIVDTIIHESVHVVQGLKAFIGEENAGREFEAYTTAHIATTLMQEYERLSNALSEKREAGLQNRVPEVPLEAGAASKPEQTDSSPESSERIWTHSQG